MIASLAAAALATLAATGAGTVPGGTALTVEASPLEITVGDRVEAVLTLRAGPDLDGIPAFPVWEEHWGDAEILATEPPADQGRGVWRQRLTLTVFETGLATLPAVEVGVPMGEGLRTVASEPLVVEVRSVLPEDEAEVAPQPPAPVRRLPVGRSFWWAAAALGLACAVLAWLAFRRAREIARAVAALSLSPIEALTRALERLRSETDPERLVTRLSLELRRYLGRAIGFRAAEGTTTEIQRDLRGRELPPELVRETLDLLRDADRVKFARGEADPEWARRRLDDAGELARRVEEWLRPPEPEPSSEAAL